ncbi:MAG: hypothetical protein NTZ68_03655 [Candidatus Dependentiae bacterium]|nr:hypothetical protein [Candidatus Dependentiae bacterium]
MKIQNKLLLLAIASVVSTSIMPNTFYKSAAQSASLEDSIAAEKANTAAMEARLDASVSQAREVEKSAEFSQLSGPEVRKHRQRRALLETASGHTKSYKEKIRRHEEKNQRHSDLFNKDVTAHSKQVKDDNMKITNKASEAVPAAKPNKVPSYTKGGQAVL